MSTSEGLQLLSAPNSGRSWFLLGAIVTVFVFSLTVVAVAGEGDAAGCVGRLCNLHREFGSLFTAEDVRTVDRRL
jgi:hypothetical protein